MIRNAVRGALVFGVTAGLAGFVWTSYEFPFAVLLPAAIGWYAIVRHEFTRRRAVAAAVVGGLTFTALLIAGMFFAITDGSPVAISGWLVAVLAAGVAGGLTGLVVGGVRAAAPISVFSISGMSVALLIAAAMRELQPAAAQVPGPVQTLTFTTGIGLMGLVVGAAAGMGVAWARRHAVEGPTDAGLGNPAPTGR